jgi:hypothetical protein
MCLTLFNTAVDRFSFIQTGEEYLFSDGTIKKIRQEYESHGQTGNPYQINIDDKNGKIERLDTNAAAIKVDVVEAVKPKV